MSDDYVPDELREHDVAVVVFVRAPGIHYNDATDRARAAVTRTLRMSDGLSPFTRGLPTLQVPNDPTNSTVLVLAVVGLDTAFSNRYVEVRPSTRLQHDLRLPELPTKEDE